MTRTSTPAIVENGNAPALVSQNEIEARLAEYTNAAEGAFATATEKARASDSRIWAQWCSDHEAPIVPADPQAVVAFIDRMAETRKPATVRRYLQTLNAMHKAAQCDPVTKSAIVSLALRRMDRAKGTAPDRAQPVLIDTVRQLLASIEAETATIDTATKAGQRRNRVCIRDRALIALAYFSALRRSEVVALDLADIDLSAKTITVRRSKTDQTGAGSTRGISADVAAILRQYIETAGIAPGPLFLSANGNRLSGIDVARVLKARCASIGIDPSRISGHSTRRGAITDRVQVGETAQQIANAFDYASTKQISVYSDEADKAEAAARVSEKLGSLIDG